MPTYIHTLQAKTWVTDFLSPRRHEGYQKPPYMHAVVYHVPSMIRQHGNLLMFSGQGTCTHYVNILLVKACARFCRSGEKRRHGQELLLFTSNRHDPCAEASMCEKRVEALQECRRQKRAYNKRDESYSSTGIFSKRARAE